MTYTFIDEGSPFIDDANCVACRETTADNELQIDGKYAGYVCDDCLAAVHKGGMAAWHKRMRAIARLHRKLATIAENSAAAIAQRKDVDVKLHLEIRRDAYGDHTAVERFPEVESGRGLE